MPKREPGIIKAVNDDSGRQNHEKPIEPVKKTHSNELNLRIPSKWLLP
jgi:hypothetical protein